MSKKEFRVQISRRGDAWEDDHSREFDADALEDQIKAITNKESHGGKYSYRIVNQDGVTVATAYNAEYAPPINARDPSWLGNVLRAYPHLTQQDIAVACRVWLFLHNIPEAEDDI